MPDVIDTCHCAIFLLYFAPVEFTEKVRIMDEARINRALARLASEIVEENHGLTDLVLVGIRRRGVPLANRIADKIEDLEGNRPPVGMCRRPVRMCTSSGLAPRRSTNIERGTTAWGATTTGSIGT